MKLFEPMHPPKLEHTVIRDVSYGPDERHLLDVHPGHSGGSAPVVCFVHGGGFAGGSKGSEGQPFYDNICTWALGSGFVAVNATYRLAPGAPFPAGAEDLRLALMWVSANIKEHGGDPDKIVFFGHSAGASHVATMIARRTADDPLLAGAILSSGIYDPSLDPEGPVSYFGRDPSKFPAMSSIEALCSTEVPLLVSTAELDPPLIQIHTAKLLERYFTAHQALPHLVQAEGHNHFSVMFHIGTDETSYSDRLARFVSLLA